MSTNPTTPDSKTAVSDNIRFSTVRCLEHHDDKKSFHLTYKKPTYTDKSNHVRIRAVVLENGEINIRNDENHNYTDEELRRLTEHGRAFLKEHSDNFGSLTLNDK